MKYRTRLALLALFFIITMGQISSYAGPPIDDRDSLRDVQTTKAIFDMSVSSADHLELYLNVIKKTHADLIRQGQNPDFVIAFRGASVRLINTETWSFEEEDQQSLKRSRAVLQELKQAGVKLEACSVATNLHKIENATILPEVKVVGNTFISLIGYQAKGYSLVPIQ